MAYVQKSLLEDKEEGAPQVSATTAPTISGPSLGSTASFGGTAGNVGSGGLAQQGGGAGGGEKSQSPAAGTGFTNIDKVLEANKNAGAQVAGVAGQTRNKENTAFNGGFSTAMAGVNAQPGAISGDERESLVKGLQTNTEQFADVAKEGVTNEEGATGEAVYSPTGQYMGRKVTYTERQKVADDDRSGAVKAAQDALARTYQGPKSFEYDVGQTDAARDLRGLGNVDSVGATIAGQSGALANYNTGLSAIDRAIYGNLAGGEIAQVGKDNDAMIADQKAKQQSVATAATDKANGILSSQYDLVKQLGGIGSNLQAVDAARGVNTHQNSLKAIGQVLGDNTLGATVNQPRLPNIAQAPVPQAQAPATPSVNFAGEDKKSYDNLVRLGYAPEEAAQRIRSQIAGNLGNLPTDEYVRQAKARGMSDQDIKKALASRGETWNP